MLFDYKKDLVNSHRNNTNLKGVFLYLNYFKNVCFKDFKYTKLNLT